MIVRNEEQHLGACLASFRDHVDELIIADTGSVDRTVEIAKSYGATVIDCSPEVRPELFFRDEEYPGIPGPFTGHWVLGNFAGARNVSWNLATSDYVVWVDADDTVRHPERLRDLAMQLKIDSIPVARLVYDLGTTKIWRERLIARSIGSKWVGEIHETIDTGNATRRSYDSVVFDHRREAKTNAAAIPNRNFKILKRMLDREGDKPSSRTLFYIANEAYWSDRKLAQDYYRQYLKVATWNEERCVALCYMGRMAEMDTDYEAALQYYGAASVESPHNPDGWFGAARCAYFRGRWQECVKWSEIGFKLGNPETLPWYNPLERTGEPYVYYTYALSSVGRQVDALAACKAGLAALPGEDHLTHNLPLLEAAVKEEAEKKKPAPRPVALKDVRGYSVTIISPPNYPHSAAFEEVAESLSLSLKALGHDVVTTRHPGGKLADNGRRHIVLGSNLIPYANVELPSSAILYNLEQVGKASPWITPWIADLFRRHRVWDYSVANADALVAMGLPRPTVVPIGWLPQLQRIPRASAEDIDVLFYGSLNERRQNVLDSIASLGVKVEKLFGVYGAERDAMIARSKLVLNVHFYESKVFEIVRASYLLGNGRVVVSETGCEPSEEKPLESAVAFASYADLPARCLALLSDASERQRRSAEGVRLMTSRPMTEYVARGLAAA